ncbi:hypothetical protein J6590_074361 [Homalodisca vitripennis]|nr:hypothetical protein J6590_074361 [Homalodisca vitripennis]
MLQDYSWPWIVCKKQTCRLINNVLVQQEPLYLAERLCSRCEIVAALGRITNSSLQQSEVGDWSKGGFHFGTKLSNGLPCGLNRLKDLVLLTDRPDLRFVRSGSRRMARGGRPSRPTMDPPF